jgi:hypothetical protein
MFAAVSVVPLLMWANARTRLSLVRSLVARQPWPVVKAYTAGDRGYVAMKIAERLVTLSFGKDKATPAMIVRVDLPAPGLPHFDIAPHSFIGRLTLDSRAGDTFRIGHDNFDHVYRTRSQDPAGARSLWTAELCNRFRGDLPHASVRGDAEAVVLGVDSMASEDIAVRAVQLALDIACADAYGLGALRALPDATLRVTDAGLEVELPGASPIRLAPVRTKAGVVTVASVDEGVVPERHPDLTQIGPATLATDGPRVTLTWPGIETDRARLVAAVDLLRTLGGAPRDGAYR